jgi:hypothetical protein
MKKLSLMVACLGIISAATFGNTLTVQQDVKKQKEQQAPNAKTTEQAKPQPAVTATPAAAKQESPKQEPAKAEPAKKGSKVKSKAEPKTAKATPAAHPNAPAEKAEPSKTK